MKHMGKVTRSTFLMGVVSASLIAAANDAWATTEVFSPFGDAKVSAWVNHDPGDGGEWINWQNDATQECVFTRLGIGQISDNFRIHLPPGGGSIRVVSTDSGATCGFQMQALNYGGHFVDLIGSDGPLDELYSTGTGDTFIFGLGGAKNYLHGGRPGVVILGGPGNDFIVSEATNLSTYDSSTGDDCFGIALLSGSPDIIRSRSFCGSGNDNWDPVVWPWAVPADCESTKFFCPNGL